MQEAIVVKQFPAAKSGHQIMVIQSGSTRAINVGFIRKDRQREAFIPGRLNFGSQRAGDTYQATLQSLKIPQVKKILEKYKTAQISTVTVLRETLACRAFDALSEVGFGGHFGDAFIGATHIKGKGPIKTAYLYENIEGLVPDGLWIVADSFCMGRNLYATMQSLLKKFKPAEVIFLAPVASRRAIEYVDQVLTKKQIPTTYIAWGALFGVDEVTKYDMPWGHPDTEVLDERDKRIFLKMYSKDICVGGDFGNNYYSPMVALQLYQDELKEHRVTPNIPTAAQIRSIYKLGEILIR